MAERTEQRETAGKNFTYENRTIFLAKTATGKVIILKGKLRRMCNNVKERSSVDKIVVNSCIQFHPVPDVFTSSNWLALNFLYNFFVGNFSKLFAFVKYFSTDKPEGRSNKRLQN